MALIKRMAAVRAARENATGGAERIRAELGKLGVDARKSLIQEVKAGVRKHRVSKQTWAAFLHTQGHEIWACDFLQTSDIFLRPVFVFIGPSSAAFRASARGVTEKQKGHPNQGWPQRGRRELASLRQSRRPDP